ncbi:MAG: hypothetical protein RLZZ245_137 [Verrucomicrobiota bacterium]
MITEPPSDKRSPLTCHMNTDLVVVGGGLSGTCCAIAAAREGIKVVLIQDRPVLGGNASSEVRLWILGATSHMGNNNRWAREGGVIDEILVENLYRNPEGNSLILDTILLEMVHRESNITLLLNTSVHDLEKSAPDTISSVRAFCSQNSTLYEVSAPLFTDASGDGILGFIAGAAFRIGGEPSSEFNEGFAPPTPQTDLLGHTIYFYSRDTGRSVKFHPPAFALSDIADIPRWRDFKADDSGCRLWWLEWGGRRDTIHDSEEIKWELWRIVYGVWNHIKNSGLFPEADTLTLEWVGTIPGKRESRRFEGDCMIHQRDIVEQIHHPDFVSFGGWAIDLHPADGVYSPESGCTQWHSKGVYGIPYRSLYSRNINNLFLAGRIISASHVAFGSTRVMATCAHSGQAVGIAAAQCIRDNSAPRALLETGKMADLQRQLLRTGQYIPGVPFSDPSNLVASAEISSSSELKLAQLIPSGETLPLLDSWAMMLPLAPGAPPIIEFTADVDQSTTLRAELRVSSKPGNHTPDLTLASLDLSLEKGKKIPLKLQFDAHIPASGYTFICLIKNENLHIHLSEQRLTGVLAVCHNGNKAVAKSATQSPPPGIGIDTFEFWTPKRRPAGKNFALSIDPPLAAFSPSNLNNGFDRPIAAPNAWVADFGHEQPLIRLRWKSPVTIRSIEMVFDTDFDHPMESVLMGHPERVMPFCVQNVQISAHVPIPVPTSSGPHSSNPEHTNPIAEIVGNHLSQRVIQLSAPITTDQLDFQFVSPSANIPVSLFSIRCFA